MYILLPLLAPSISKPGETLTISSEGLGLSSKGGDTAGYGFQEYTDQFGNLLEAYIEGTTWTQSSSAPSFWLPLGSESVLHGINSSGDAVGVRGFDNSPTQVPILVRGGGVTDLTPAIPAGSLALDINDGGRGCGWGWNDPRAFVFDAPSKTLVTWINPLPGNASCGAHAINDQGDVAGASGSQAAGGGSPGTHGFLFDGVTKATKDLGPVVFVAGLNNARVVCGSIGLPFPQSFGAAICDTTQPSPAFTAIAPPAGFIGSHANDINDWGDVVGTCWTQSTYDTDQQCAYIYHNGVSTDLNTLVTVPGWHLTFAERINNDGYIVGTGTMNGEKTAFLLVPFHFVPPPPRGWPWWIIPIPELVLFILFGITNDSGGVAIPIGPVPPWGPPDIARAWEAWLQISAAKRDALMALALDEVAMYISDRAAREKVRTALIDVSRDRLHDLMGSVAQGRQPPILARFTGARPHARGPRLMLGKSQAAIARSRFHRREPRH
jgi:probable HAF family extracellular repeat protein